MTGSCDSFIFPDLLRLSHECFVFNVYHLCPMRCYLKWYFLSVGSMIFNWMSGFEREDWYPCIYTSMVPIVPSYWMFPYMWRPVNIKCLLKHHNCLTNLSLVAHIINLLSAFGFFSFPASFGWLIMGHDNSKRLVVYTVHIVISLVIFYWRLPQLMSLPVGFETPNILWKISWNCSNDIV